MKPLYVWFVLFPFWHVAQLIFNTLFESSLVSLCYACGQLLMLNCRNVGNKAASWFDQTEECVVELPSIESDARKSSITQKDKWAIGQSVSFFTLIWCSKVGFQKKAQPIQRIPIRRFNQGSELYKRKFEDRDNYKFIFVDIVHILTLASNIK